MPLDVIDQNIDLLSISGHKIYGPKGVGALYIRRKPRVRLVAQMSGGGQEKGHRSGTLSPPVWLCSFLINYIVSGGSRSSMQNSKRGDAE